MQYRTKVKGMGQNPCQKLTGNRLFLKMRVHPVDDFVHAPHAGLRLSAARKAVVFTLEQNDAAVDAVAAQGGKHFVGVDHVAPVILVRMNEKGGRLGVFGVLEGRDFPQKLDIVFNVRPVLFEMTHYILHRLQ